MTTTALLDEYQALLTGVDETTASVTSVDPSTITSSDTLVVVDMQHDFLPGGSFGVAEGFEIMDGICALIQKFHEAGATVVTKQLDVVRGKIGGQLRREDGAPGGVIVKNDQRVGRQRLEVGEVQVTLQSLLLLFPGLAGVPSPS